MQDTYRNLYRTLARTLLTLEANEREDAESLRTLELQMLRTLVVG